MSLLSSICDFFSGLFSSNPSATSAASKATGLTGVEQYIRNQPALTGVAKYIISQTKAAKGTSVEQYIRNQG